MRLARPIVNFKRGLIVPLGLHLGEYENLPAAGTFRRAFPEVGDRKIVLFLGRINFKKGLDLLIPAFSRVARERNDMHLVIAGPEDEGFGQQIKNLVGTEGVGEITTHTGMLEGELKFAALQDASMFVLPSYSENFGISIAEAMACGLPVLISNKVNIWPEIEAAKAGLVGDCAVSQFVGFIDELLQDPDRATEMGRHGRKLVKSNYAWPRIALMLDRAYHSVLADSAPQ